MCSLLQLAASHLLPWIHTQVRVICEDTMNDESLVQHMLLK